MNLSKVKFNLTHWCINADDYEEAKKDILDEKIFKKGYMEKADLKDYYALNCNCRKQEVRTSGSTGQPVRFWCNASRIASSLALVEDRFKELGKTDDTVFMRLWYPTTGHKWHQNLKEKLFRKDTKEIFFSYFDLVNGKKKMKDFVLKVIHSKPDFLEGYAGGIISAASFIKNHGLDVKVGTIVTGAGQVTEAQHKLIEEAFNCKHYDRYGCSEFGEIAHQMDKGYYEPNPMIEIEVSDNLEDFYFLEEAKDGYYEIFITDYRNTCTNFWRYRMNDIVKIKDGKIVAIEGRTEEVFEVGDDHLPSGIFYQAMKDFNVDQWQVEIQGKHLIIRTEPKKLQNIEQKIFEEYFKGYSFTYDKGNFTTVGRRKKIKEVICLR